MNEQKVWFVTGASKGLGLTLVRKLLEDGYKVAATSRSLKSIEKEIGSKSENFFPIEMDVVNEKSVQTAISTTLNYFQTIDVVVNNAGYGQIGALEELSDEETRKNYDVNVFGVLNVIRAVMPHFRSQKSGHFFNISSIGGYTANFAGWGIYCSSKFAVSAITEALAAEVTEFGVKATLVYPGYFKTNFLGEGSLMTPATPIEDYKSARQSQAFHENEMNGNQQGDPEKAADVLIKMSGEEHPALHLFLGEDAYNGAYSKIESVKADLELWKSMTLSTSFN